MKTIYIEGMMCEHCKKHVEDAFLNLGLNANVSLQDKKAIIDQEFDDKKIIDAINDAGYKVKEIING